MMDALAYITQNDGVGAEHLETFDRLRAARIQDPYNPDSTVEDWDAEPDTISVEGWFASYDTNSTLREEASREQLTTTQHIIFEPGTDVRKGDRLRLGDRVWHVEAFPQDAANPWTGWRPTLVVVGKEVLG